MLFSRWTRIGVMELWTWAFIWTGKEGMVMARE